MGLFQKKKKETPVFSGEDNDDKLEQMSTSGRVMRRAQNKSKPVVEEEETPKSERGSSGRRGKRGSKSKSTTVDKPAKPVKKEPTSPKMVSPVINSAMPKLFTPDSLTHQWDEDLSYTKWVLESAADFGVDPIVNVPNSQPSGLDELVDELRVVLCVGEPTVEAEPEVEEEEEYFDDSDNSDEVVVEVL